jgi:hypothetical protein
MTFVAEFLMAGSGGKCPDCGATVVVEESAEDRRRRAPLLVARSNAEKLAVRIEEPELSVRTQLALAKLGIATVGDLLRLAKEHVRSQFAQSSYSFEEVTTLLAEHGIDWTA